MDELDTGELDTGEVNKSAPVETEIILASASRARLAMLRAAGVPCRPEPARIDEAEIKASLRAEGFDAANAATALAEHKAARISHRLAAIAPGMLVIGADQILEHDGAWLDKPADGAAARAQLIALRGERHRLVSAVCALRDGQRLWHHVDDAYLTMRPFGDGFLDSYLQRMGDAVANTVGGYELEGLGAQLFARVEGDHFTILGMPLLPLLDFLRIQGVLVR